MKELIEKYETLKKSKEFLEDKIKEIKEKMSEIEGKIYTELDNNNQDGAIIGNKKVQIKTRRVYSANDWNMVYSHIIRTRDFSLLQARLSITRLRELENDGVSIQDIGVKGANVRTLSVSSVSKNG